MDRMIYVGMTGAKQAMEQQAAVANNMAIAPAASKSSGASARRSEPAATLCSIIRGSLRRWCA